MDAEEHPAPSGRVRIGASWSILGNVGRMVISAGGTILIAALAGPAYKGTLATLSALSWMVAVVLSLGLDGAIRYYVATKKWSLPQANVVILGLTTIAAVVAFFGFGVARSVAPDGILADLSTLELTAATTAVLLGMLAMQGVGAIRGFSFYAKVAMASALANPLIFVGLRALGVAVLPSALWAYIGAQVALAVPTQLFLIWKAKWRFARPNDAKGAAWYGLRSLGFHLFNLANLRFDVLMLRGLSTASATGAYSLATTFSEAVWLIPNSVGAVLFPEIAEGGHDQGTWTARVCRLVAALSTLLALVAGLAASLLIVVALPAYRASIPALWLLLPGTIATATSQILVYDLNARRLPQASLMGAGGALAVTVIGDLALIPLIGINGAAIVSSFAYIANTLILSRFFVKATESRATALLPRFSDLGEALRMAIKTARDFLRRRPAGQDA